MSDQQADVAGAIEVITQITKSLEKRLSVSNANELALKWQRNQRLNREVNILLPNLSAKTLTKLQSIAPSVGLDSQVQTAFAQNKKFLLIFKSQKYRTAMTLIQVRVKVFLEKSGCVRNEDRLLAKYLEEKSQIQLQLTEALALLQALEKTRGANNSLPKSTIDGINRIARRHQDKDFRTSLALSPRLKIDATEHSDPNPSDDLWFWIRNLFPDASIDYQLEILRHHDVNSAHVVDTTHSNSIESNSSEGDCHVAPPHVANHLGHSNSHDCIATDDRLGAFS